MSEDLYKKIAKNIVDAIKNTINEKEEDDDTVINKNIIILKPIEVFKEECSSEKFPEIINKAFEKIKVMQDNSDAISNAISGIVAGITGTTGITGKAGETKTVGETKKADSISGTISKEEFSKIEEKSLNDKLNKIAEDIETVTRNLNNLKECHIAHKEKMKNEIAINNKIIEAINDGIKKINNSIKEKKNSDNCCCEKKEITAAHLATKLSRYNPEWIYGDCLNVANKLLEHYSVIRK